MYLQRLKSKYKEILHPSSQDENNENQQPYKTSLSIKKNDFRVLTEYSQNSNKSQSIVSSSAYVLALKEKIAQATHNLISKDQQIKVWKEEILRKDEHIKMLQQTLENSKKTVELTEQRVIEAKVVSATLQKDVQKLKEQIEAFLIDRQLAIKQTEYYKSETSKINKEKISQGKLLDSCQKSLKEVDALKYENSRLREDIKRLNTIINQMCQQRLKTDVSDKHYLGKPLKEASMWFSQNLVGEVQHFLKKQQIGQGNRKFLNNLVKFIFKCSGSSTKSKHASSQNSRVKSTGKNSHARSASVCDPGYSSIHDLGTELIKRNQCSITSSLKKSLLISKYKKLDSRKYTTGSLSIPQRDGNASTCEQILGEYRRVLKQALKEKPIKSKTIMELSDEMSSTVIQLFEEQAN